MVQEADEAALELQKGRKQRHGSNAFPNIGHSLPFFGDGVGRFHSRSVFKSTWAVWCLRTRFCSVIALCWGRVWRGYWGRIRSFFVVLVHVFLAVGKPVDLAKHSTSLSLNTIITSDLTGFWLEACIWKY